MSTLQEIVKTSSTKKNAGSSKTPQFYNRERLLCIQELSENENADVRRALAENEHTPTKILTAMMSAEQDSDVLKAILLHPNLPIKSILLFVSNDPRTGTFDEDPEIIDLVQNAVG